MEDKRLEKLFRDLDDKYGEYVFVELEGYRKKKDKTATLAEFILWLYHGNRAARYIKVITGDHKKFKGIYVHVKDISENAVKFQIEKREKDLDTNEEKILRKKIHIDNNLPLSEQLNQIYNQLDIILNQLNINDIISVFFKKGPQRKLINFDSIEERIVKKLPLLGNQITLAFTTALKSIFPSVLDKSGQRHVVQLKGQLRKSNKDFKIKIIAEREDDIESVKKIFDENLNFNEYISSVIKINSEYNFKDNRVNVTLELIIQLYTNDDYYDTIVPKHVFRRKI